jgi:hypothetical protein
MKESFLHFIWELQYFHKKNLTTCQGDEIHIIHPGISNTDSGPDFSNAKIRIGNIEWFGNIEIHIKSSEWYQHSHHHDPEYYNIILHVVWKNDKNILHKDGTPIPTIELKDRIDEGLILKYKSMVNSPEVIPCSKALPDTPDIHKTSMLDKVLIRRIESKAAEVNQLLIRNKHNWEETAYQVLAKNFGFKINCDPFLMMSQGLPLKILSRHCDNLRDVEALLFGQAGFLEHNFEEEYPRELKKEYAFLSHKYSLSSARLSEFQWKFLRIRPANFPTVRIAEFAALIHKLPSLFSSFIEFENTGQIHKALDLNLSAYWDDHYYFDKKVKGKGRKIGKASIENIILNTIVPILVCYAKEKDNNDYIERAIHFLEFLPPEENKITKLWAGQGLCIDNAFDSQAVIELYNNFCRRKNCLNCNIGINILNPG